MSRGEWALLLVVVGASLAIVGNTTYLPMNDAPSHIGTSVIALETLKGDQFFTAHYRVLPVPLPYWANTLLMLPLVPLIGALQAFVVVMALYIVALPLSFYVLMRTAAPENVRLTAVAALAAFNWAYWLGEANFILGQSAVLFALALFLRIPVWGARAVVGFLAAAAFAYASHIFAITALLVAIGALTLLSLASRLHPSLARWRFVRTQWLVVFAAVGMFAVGAFFILQRGTTNYLDYSRAYFGIIFDLRPWKLAKVAIDPFQSPTMSGAWPALAFSTIVGVVLLFSGRRALGGVPRTLGSVLETLNPALFAAAVALLGLFYFGPVGTVREGAIGQRFVLLGFLLFLGAFRLGRSRWGTVLLTTAVAVFGVYKLTDAWRLHRSYDAVVTDVSRNLLSRIPERSRVLPLKDITATEEVHYLYHRIANYVVVERHSYSANILATTGQQPLQHVRAHRAPHGHRASQRSPSEKQLDESDWEYYDYLVVQTDRERPEVSGIEERATLVGEARGFKLYRVNRAAASPK